MGLFDIFTNNDADKAAQDKISGLNAGYSQASDLFGQGRDALNSSYGQANSLYAPLVASTTAGSNAYGDASGANGVGGLQNAMNTFKNSGQYGAYGFSLDQGLQALDRTHAAAGNLSSGNADTDAMKYATGLAGQTYNSYLSGLSPYLGANSSAVSGAAGAQTGQGTALNNSYQTQGGLGYQTQVGIGNANAAADMANQQANQNIWNGIMGVGKLAASFI
jgi:hypothetical protein